MRFLLLLTIILGGCANATIPKNFTNSFILTNVNIVDVVEQRIQRDKNVIVKEGKITAIVNANEDISYPNIRHIEGNGGFVTPGLIDMHVHMYEKAAYLFALSHGVTHVRIMNGIPAHLEWREQVNSGQLIGSSSTVSSPILSAYDDAYLHHAIHTEKQAKEAIRKYNKAGYDLIKAYGNLNEETLSTLVAEGQRLNMPIAKHGPHASKNMKVQALSSFQSFEHVEDIFQGPLNYQFDSVKLPNIISELKATGVPITPTLNIFAQLTKLSVQKEGYLAKTTPEYTSDIITLEASHNQVKRWLNSSDKMAQHNDNTLNFLLHITKELHEKNVPLLVGSDSGVLLSPHGLATHEEMRLLSKAGLPAFEVLKAATLNPAKALSLENELGQIAKSFQADLIFTSANPIENLDILSEPLAVIKSGRWLSQQTLNAMREKAIDSRSIWQEIKVLFEAL